MVVHYASGGEGSWKSIFTTLPRILIRMDGSVLPHITPQLLIVAALGVLATFWNPLRGTELESEGGSQGGNVVVEVDNSLKLQPAMSVVGILLSFLMVFKTQNGFGQFWAASRDIQEMLSCTRHLCRLTVTSFEWTDNDQLSEKEREAAAELRSKVRKVLRLLVLHFFVMVEYFQRTGDEETSSMEFKTQMTLRSNIRKLTGGSDDDFTPEFKAMYKVDEVLQDMRVGLRACRTIDDISREAWQDAVKRASKKGTEDGDRAGTCKDYNLDARTVLNEDIVERIVEQERRDLMVHTVPACNPLEVLFWVQIVLKRLSLLSRAIAKDPSTSSLLGIEPPLEGQFYALIDKLESKFGSMDLVDKTQFPFPYSQIMKILLYFWVLCQPFVLEIQCGAATPAVMVLIGIGFFGLDEVGEILESPFGNDPNHLDLMEHAQDLVNDVEMLFEKAKAPISPVLHDTKTYRHFFGQLNLDTADRRGNRHSSYGASAAGLSRTPTRTSLASLMSREWEKVQDHTVELVARASSTPQSVVSAFQQRSSTPPKKPAEALPPAELGAQP